MMEVAAAREVDTTAANGGGSTKDGSGSGAMEMAEE